MTVLAVEVFRTGDDPVAILPDEVGLFLFGFAMTCTGTFLGFAQPQRYELARLRLRPTKHVL